MAKKAVENKEKYVTVTQIASPIGRGDAQLKTLIGLGLNKLGRSRVLLNNESTLGMIKKVNHLIKVEQN